MVNSGGRGISATALINTGYFGFKLLILINLKLIVLSNFNKQNNIIMFVFFLHFYSFYINISQYIFTFIK